MIRVSDSPSLPRGLRTSSGPGASPPEIRPLVPQHAPMKAHRLLPALVALATPALAQSPQQEVGPEPVITVQGRAFMTWSEYTSSDLFRELGLRCGSPPREETGGGSQFRPASDCDNNNTTIRAAYDPVTILDIPVVVHVIENTSGQGAISNALVQSQIDILNEDFLALAGSNGAPGTNTMIQFHLATEDPVGNPTNGITRSVDNNWFNDSGSYWNSLAWDTDRYMNIYTNSASGNLGYVPALPANSGIVGSNSDRVVVLWSSFGRNAPIGPPYNQGRTATHEVGHYLGLPHTFSGGCAGGNCYQNGDLVCDTNDESSPNFGCGVGSTSCGSTDPVENYMDYSDDLCMNQFTPEQTNRMRCTLEFWRPDLAISGVPNATFSGVPTSGIKPLDVTFSDASTGNVTSWLWDFGDGNSSTQQNPTHTYVDGGLFTVSLTVTGPTGSNTSTLTDYVDVAEGPPASFVYRNGNGQNPFVYTANNDPIVGMDWKATVGLAGANTSFVGVSALGTAGFVIARGQVLIQPPTLKPLNQGVTGLHTFPIANDVSLVGQTFYTQAARVAPGNIEYLNAIDITIGY